MNEPIIEVKTIGDRRVFSVDVGPMSDEQIKQFMQTIVNEMKKNLRPPETLLG